MRRYIVVEGTILGARDLPEEGGIVLTLGNEEVTVPTVYGFAIVTEAYHRHARVVVEVEGHAALDGPIDLDRNARALQEAAAEVHNRSAEVQALSDALAAMTAQRDGAVLEAQRFVVLLDEAQAARRGATEGREAWQRMAEQAALERDEAQRQIDATSGQFDLVSVRLKWLRRAVVSAARGDEFTLPEDDCSEPAAAALRRLMDASASSRFGSLVAALCDLSQGRGFDAEMLGPLLGVEAMAVLLALSAQRDLDRHARTALATSIPRASALAACDAEEMRATRQRDSYAPTTREYYYADGRMGGARIIREALVGVASTKDQT